MSILSDEETGHVAGGTEAPAPCECDLFQPDAGKEIDIFIYS